MSKARGVELQKGSDSKANDELEKTSGKNKDFEENLEKKIWKPH